MQLEEHPGNCRIVHCHQHLLEYATVSTTSKSPSTFCHLLPIYELVVSYAFFYTWCKWYHKFKIFVSEASSLWDGSFPISSVFYLCRKHSEFNRSISSPLGKLNQCYNTNCDFQKYLTHRKISGFYKILAWLHFVKLKKEDSALWVTVCFQFHFINFGLI